MANIFENVYNWLKEKGKENINTSDNGPGPYTGDAGSVNRGVNTSTYSNAVKQENKAYNQPFTSSTSTTEKNYTPVSKNVSNQKAYNQPFNNDSNNSSKQVSTSEALVNLSRNQNYLTDTKKALPESQVGKAITSVTLKTTDAITNALDNISDSIKEKNQIKIDQNVEQIKQQNIQTLQNASKEDLSFIMDEKGGFKDFSTELSKLNNRKTMLESAIENNPTAKIELEEVNKQIERYNSLENLKNAAYENSVLEYYGNSKSEEALSFKEQLSHKNDNFIQRGGNALGHLLVETANIVPTVLDEAREGGNSQLAKQELENLKQMLENGSITQEEYKNTLKYWNDYIEESRTINSDNLSQQIRSLSNQINANTYYGASDVEKFVIQAGESTAQFLLHYTLFKGASVISMSTASGSQKMNMLLQQGVDYDTAAKNGFLTGCVSYFTEKLPIENFEKVVLNGAGEKVLAHIMNSITTQSFNEGLEELIEGLVDPVIDSLTLGVPCEINGTELLNSFLLGAASGAMGGALGGSFGKLNIKINNKHQINQSQMQIDALQQMMPSMDSEHQSFARRLIEQRKRDIAKFRMANPYIDAFSSPNDTVESTTVAQDEQSIYDTLTPDFNNEIQENKALDEIQDIIKSEAVKTELNELSELEGKANEDVLEIKDKNNPAFYSYKNLSGIRPREIKTYETASNDFKEVRKQVWNNLKEDKMISNRVTGDSYAVNSKSITNSKLWTPGGYTALQNIMEIFYDAIPINSTENINPNHERYGNKYTVFYNEFSDGKNVYLVRIYTENEAPNNNQFRPNLHKVKSIDIEPLNNQNKKDSFREAGETSKGSESSTFTIDKLLKDVNNFEGWRNDLSDDVFSKLNKGEQKNYQGKDLDYRKLASIEDEVNTVENMIHNSMSMDEAHRMLEKAWNRISDYFDENSLEEFLEKEPSIAVDELAMTIDNTYDLQEEYINSNQDILDEVYSIYDVIDAYLNGSLKQENKSFKLKDIDYTKGNQLESTFFTPNNIEVNQETLNLAKQRMTKQNRDEVLKARGDIIAYAHNLDAAEKLGLSNADINRLVRSWSTYSANARSISQNLNNNVPTEYRWSGLENSNNLNRYLLNNDVNKQDTLSNLVKEVDGNFDDYSANDLINVMLSLDSHIDYKNLSIFFDQRRESFENHKNARGFYSSQDTKITIGDSGVATLAHETGHYIDNLWGREITNRLYGQPYNHYLSEMPSTKNLTSDNEALNTFVSNYNNFIDKLTSKSDIRSKYTQSRTETFARFIDYFVAWVNKTAGGYGRYEGYYNDNFNVSDCYDFVKLLQQKNLLNATVLSEVQTENVVNGDTDINYDLDTNNIVKDARKDLREISDKSRRVNLTETLNEAVNDIRETGEISDNVYADLRQKVIDSTIAKIPNDNYEVAQNIREMVGNNFARLNKADWDVVMKDINDSYHIYDEDSIGLNTVQDAQEFLDNYLNSIGGKYNYASPVELGYMSETEYEDMIDNKLNDVITSIKDSIARNNTDTISSELADRLINEQELEEAFNRIGQDNLDSILSEEDNMKNMMEEASIGSLSTEQLDELEKQAINNISIEDAKKETPTILKDVAKNKPLRKEKDLFYKFKQKMFDKGIAIRDYKSNKLSASYDYLLQAENMANYAILNGIYDNESKQYVSDSLTSISKLIPESQKNDFDYYMYHKHNIDAAKYHKDVFMGFPAEKSQQIVDQYEREHPDWIKVANKYYQYNDMLLKRQVDSGVISQQMADLWKEMYPHYVPTKRVMAPVDDANVVETEDPQVISSNKGTLNERTGGTSPIQPLDYAMSEHTKQVYRSTLFNKFAEQYVRTSNSKTTLFNETRNHEDVITGVEEYLTKADEYTPATMIWYDNGDRKIVELPQKVYDALAPSETPFNLPYDVPFLSWATKLRTNMITGANPVFWTTNAFKDFQDIAFNSKYAKDTYMNLPRAYKELLSNGEIANLYKANGGEYLTYSSELGINQNESNSIPAKVIGAIGGLNNLIETAPRLAEFMSSLDHGNSIEQAIYNASEVTTNFKRGGDYAKWINRNGANFFNASIQGFDKQVRNITDSYDQSGWKGVVSYMAKAVLISGIPLAVINGLLWKDDDDYEQLSDYIKNDYYLLFKYGDGKFFRIPKGRIANAYQGIMSSMYKNGKELLSDDSLMNKATSMWNESLDSILNVWEQVGMNNPLENNMLSPIIQVLNNRSWYGEPIVSSYMEKKDKKDQWDETTDAISIELGKRLNLSPKKINYLIDQYSGGVGDFLLPMMTLKSETGIDDGTPLGKTTSLVASPFVDKFTTDSVFKNQYVTDFFDLNDRLYAESQKENASDESIIQNKYIYALQKEINELYAQRRNIYMDDSLTDAQKYELTKGIQQQIVDIAKLGLDSYDNMDLESYYGSVNGISFYKDREGSWKKVDQDREDKMNSLNLSSSERNDYIYTTNNIAQIRADLKAAADDNEWVDYKEPTVKALESSGLDYRIKNAIYDDYYDSDFTQRVNSMELSDEEKFAIKSANASAKSVKDSSGKTISNSKALYVADAYADAGVLDDVFEYIKANGLKPADMGLTKTVYNYSYSQLSSAYQRIYGEQFGTGNTDSNLVNVVNSSYSGSSKKTYGSSGRKYYSNKKSSRQSSSSSSKAAKAEERRIKKLRKALLQFLKNVNGGNYVTNMSSIMKNMTTAKDAQEKVKKILKNTEIS